MTGSYDYIVVGAGAAGCVVANRLSERHSVLLVEAGGAATEEWVDVPGGFLQVLRDPALLWVDWTVPGAHVHDRAIALLRGRAMGGSTSVNGMLYVRGQRADFDGWADAGCPGWSWTDVLPRFLRHTAFDAGDPAVYGRTGELSLSRVAEIHPTSEAFLAAAQQTGLPLNEDMNAGTQDGAGYVIGTVAAGHRQSAATAFIDPIADRSTLSVETGARVRRVVVQNGCAVGVEIATRDGVQLRTCTREVVLAAGAIASPQILQHSGLGPAGLLGSLGIEVVADLPEVGGNLQDHLFGHVKFRLAEGGHSMNAELSDPDRLRAHLARWRGDGSGPLTTTSSQVLAFFASEANRGSPDVQLAMRPLSWTVGESGLPEVDPFPGMMASAINTQPHGRGSVVIQSPDPEEPGLVDPAYLSDQRDVAVVVEGIRRVREIMSQTAIRGSVVAEIDPGPELLSDEQLEDYLRAKVGTVHHPTGTCRMGSDSGSVVDPHLRVRGIKNLRVIDASIMPTITSGNTMAPTYLIGEMGAEFLLSG